MTEPTADFSPREPSTVSPEPDPLRGTEPEQLPSVPGYQLLGVLGRGGMSVVYKAQQQQPSRVVALKMILRGAHASAEERLRFLQEAEAVAALRHPNIVEVYEVGQLDGVPYFTLEYIPGGSLADKTRNEPLPPRVAAEVLEPVARGVAAAHAAGFAHRDLKPDNVLLTVPLTADGLPAGGQPSWGTPKVTDFGLAKRLAIDSGLTATGAIFGTPSYMAPEQAQGSKEVGPAADVWGLGATLYKVLTGRPPFLGTTALETCGLVLSAEPVTPSQLVVGMPRDLETICLKCLQKDPAKRYASAAELADDLRRFLDGEAIRARPVGPIERAGKWVRRNPKIAAMLAVVFVALTSATAVSTAFAAVAAEQRQKAEEAARREGERADEARRAVEQGKDALARSYYEQGRSLRQARTPGRSSGALDLFRQSAELRNRPRPEGVAPSADLPSEIDLRAEAIAALAQSDVRLLQTWSLGSRPVRLSGDGRFALTNQFEPGESEGVESRYIDIATGTVSPVRFHLSVTELESFFLDDTGRRAAYAPTEGDRPVRTAVHVRELPSGKAVASLPWPRDPDRGLVVPAWAVDVSFRGDRLAAAKLDEEALWVLLWDVSRSEKPLRTYRFPNPNPERRHPVNLVELSPDGAQVLTALPDGKYAVVAADGSGEPRVHSAPGAVLRWFPGKPWWLVQVPAGEGLVHPVAWDYAAGKEVYRLPPWSAGAAITFTGDPPRLVAGTPTGTLKAFGLETGREFGETPVLHPREVSDLRTLPDGKLCTVSGSAAELRVWEPASGVGVQRAFPVPPGVNQLTPIPDSTLFVTTHTAGRGDFESFRTSHVIDSRSGRTLRSWQDQVFAHGHVGLSGGRVLAFTGTKIFALDASKGQKFVVTNAETGQELLQRFSLDFSGDPVFNLAAWELAEHDGRLLYPAYHPDRHERKALVVLDLLTRKEVRRLTHPDLLKRDDDWLTLTPDGRYLFVSPMDRAKFDRSKHDHVEIWDVAAGTVVGKVPYPKSGFLTLTPNRDGRWASSAAPGQGGTGVEVRVYAVPSGEVKLRVAGPDVTDRRAISDDGRYLAVAKVTGDVKVYDLESAQEVYHWLGLDGGPVRQLVFTRDGSLAAVPEIGTTVRVLNLPAVRKELTDRGLGW